MENVQQHCYPPQEELTNKDHTNSKAHNSPGGHNPNITSRNASLAATNFHVHDYTIRRTTITRRRILLLIYILHKAMLTRQKSSGRTRSTQFSKEILLMCIFSCELKCLSLSLFNQIINTCSEPGAFGVPSKSPASPSWQSPLVNTKSKKFIGGCPN